MDFHFLLDLAHLYLQSLDKPQVDSFKNKHFSTPTQQFLTLAGSKHSEIIFDDISHFTSQSRLTQICPHSSLSHFCPLVTFGGKAHEAFLHSCQRPPPPHSTSSTSEERPRLRSGPQRWPRPCRLWCLCHLPGPNCMLLSSPGLRSSLECSPVAEGSGGRRRWQWGQSVALQYRFLDVKQWGEKKLKINSSQIK